VLISIRLNFSDFSEPRISEPRISSTRKTISQKFRTTVVVKLRLFVAQVVQEHGMSHLVLDDGGGSPDAATRRYLEQLALERQRRGVGLGRDPRRAADEDCGVGRRGNQRNDASTGPARAVRVNTSDAARKLECALGQDWREEARLAKEAQEKARAANAASRAVREAALARESCSAWVGILVEQAMAESERRGGVAARLQASARGYAARQGLARMKKAVVSIQACRRGVVAKRVLAQMQGRRRDVAVWEERRAHERQEQRKRAEATREARLVAEAHSRATRAEAARRRREEAALAEELIMHACDNDVPLLLRALRSSEAAAHAVNTPDEGGWTALMWAASLGHGRVCVLLLEAGADVHHADADGWGALLLAVDRNHYDAAEALLMSGADPSAMCWPNRRAREQKRNGRTALDIVRARQARGAGAAAAAGTPGVPGGELFLALLTRPPPPPPPAHPSGAEEAIEQVAGGEEGGGAEQSSAGHSQSQAVSAEQGGGQRRPATAPHTGRRTVMMPSRPQSAAAAQMSSTHMSTAARELRLALDSMHGVGMGAIGSAGFSTIMHARQLGVDTVLDAMMAYADHHGVQHFGIAQLVEWQQQQEEEEGEEKGWGGEGDDGGSDAAAAAAAAGVVVHPSASLCSALLIAAAHHPTRQHDVVQPALSLLAHVFLSPIHTPPPPPADISSEEQSPSKRSWFGRGKEKAKAAQAQAQAQQRRQEWVAACAAVQAAAAARAEAVGLALSSSRTAQALRALLEQCHEADLAGRSAIGQAHAPNNAELFPSGESGVPTVAQSSWPGTEVCVCVELLLQGLRGSAEAAVRGCRSACVDADVVLPLLALLRAHSGAGVGNDGHDSGAAEIVRLVLGALCLLAAVQPRFAFEPAAFGLSAMPVLGRRRRLTLVAGDNLRPCAALLQSQSAQAAAQACWPWQHTQAAPLTLMPRCVVWWCGRRVGATARSVGSSPRWLDNNRGGGTAASSSMDLTLPPLPTSNLAVTALSSPSNYDLALEAQERPEESEMRGLETDDGAGEGSGGELRLEVWSEQELLGGTTVRLGGLHSSSIGGADAVLPPTVLPLTVMEPSSADAADADGGRAAAGALVEVAAGSVTIQLEEVVGGDGLALRQVVQPAPLRYSRTLLDDDGRGLQTVIGAMRHAASAATAADAPLEAAQMKLEVLRIGAAIALSGIPVSAAERIENGASVAEQQQSTGSSGSSEQLDDQRDELRSWARTLRASGLVQECVSAMDVRGAGGGGGGAAAVVAGHVAAALALRGMACLAALAEGASASDLPVVRGTQAAESAEARQDDARTVLGAADLLRRLLQYSDFTSAWGQPIADVCWLLLRRLRSGEQTALGQAAVALAKWVSAPEPLEAGAAAAGGGAAVNTMLAAGSVQARALHTLHWLWRAAELEQLSLQGAAPGWSATQPRQLRLTLIEARGLAGLWHEAAEHGHSVYVRVQSDGGRCCSKAVPCASTADSVSWLRSGVGQGGRTAVRAPGSPPHLAGPEEQAAEQLALPGPPPVVVRLELWASSISSSSTTATQVVADGDGDDDDGDGDDQGQLLGVHVFDWRPRAAGASMCGPQQGADWAMQESWLPLRLAGSAASLHPAPPPPPPPSLAVRLALAWELSPEVVREHAWGWALGGDTARTTTHSEHQDDDAAAAAASAGIGSGAGAGASAGVLPQLLPTILALLTPGDDGGGGGGGGGASASAAVGAQQTEAFGLLTTLLTQGPESLRRTTLAALSPRHIASLDALVSDGVAAINDTKVAAMKALRAIHARQQPQPASAERV
jgi:hypothetical protein